MTIAALILLVVLAIFLVWKEAKRPARQHRWWRIGASLLALAALAALIYPPTYTVSSGPNDQQYIALLTPGYEKDSLQAAGTPIYTTDPALSGNDIPYIPNLISWLHRQPGISGIDVYGYGLEPSLLQALQANGTTVQYHVPATPAGFIAAGWPRQLRQGEWLEVQGQYHNPTGDSVHIVLTGVGTRFDSAVIAPATTQVFHLRCRPQQPGYILYELETSAKGQAPVAEKLPVAIAPGQLLQVLVLNSSPDFDNKFLASWLHDHQYQVAVRSTVSQNKYSRQFLNQPATALQSITPALLQPLDALILDAAALAALSTGEKAAIRAQVQQGLGLILQVDSTDGKDPLTAGLQIRKQPGAAPQPRSLILPAAYQPTAPVQPTQWLTIDQQPLVQPLVTDEQGAIVAAATLQGAGKLVINTVNHTYAWMLGGHEADYARFWTALLQKAARRRSPAGGFRQVTALPTVGYPVQITLEKTTPGLPRATTPDGPLAMAQEPWLAGNFTGTWWPVQPGWQALRQGEDSTRIYVFEPRDWAAAKAMAAISNNRPYSAVPGREPTSKPEQVRREQHAVPPVIFWLVFLSCCSYLWWEEKFNTRYKSSFFQP